MKSLLSSVLDFVNFRTLNVMETFHFASIMLSYKLVHVLFARRREVSRQLWKMSARLVKKLCSEEVFNFKGV